MNKIAVIGCGYWGKNLVRNFAELGALYSICDQSPEVLSSFKEKYPHLKTFTDHQAVFQSPEIDAVVIAAPAALHYTLVKEALHAGKHVFVEKPLALNALHGEELVRLAEEKQKTLMVGHLLYYHAAVIKLKELIDSGELGRVLYIYSNRLNHGKIRTEENILWSFAPHDVSVILKLLGEMPESVTAKGASYLQENIFDTTLTTMDFRSGVKAHIYVSWLHPFKDQKLVVVGDKHMAVFDDMSDEKLLLYPHKVDWVNRVPQALKGEAKPVALELTEPLRTECQHFIDCISAGIKPQTDAEEGLRVLRVLESFQSSMEREGRSISLTKEEKPYFVHPTSFVDAPASIGAGTKIWHFSHVLKNSTVGKNCAVGQNVVIGPNAIVGDGCKIQNNVSVYDGVVLEENVFCGPSMVFTNVTNPRSAINRKSEFKKTLIKKGATIGANATVVCGHTIGKYAFIGAGAVVTKDVPDYALVYGNSATIQGWMCECGEQLSFLAEKHESRCKECGRAYRLNNNHEVMSAKDAVGQGAAYGIS